jgi:D-sedoheptulose 7-phosphate isomerase
MLSFSQLFIDESVSILRRIEPLDVERVANGLSDIRGRGGRLFILGVGGSAGHAGHAVNDFRKICRIEAYSPTDNVSELTARINDEGWETCFSEWLKISRINAADAVLVFSVGGGNRAGNVSMNIVRALETARTVGASIYGIVGRDGGFTRDIANACIVIPPVYKDRITPHTEGICAVVWHLLVSHPLLTMAPTRWEQIASANSVKV